MKKVTNKKGLLEEAQELFHNKHLAVLSKKAQCSRPTVTKILTEVNVGHPLFGIIIQSIQERKEEIKRNQELAARLMADAA